MMSWGLHETNGWKKGPWTPEEDKLLREYVGLNGEGRWSSVAKCAGLNRTGKSCRLRWVNYLRPGLKKDQLTPQEEGIIIELHGLWGNRWSSIARYLPGRTDNEIKNYWRTHFKNREKSPIKQEKRRARDLIEEKKKKQKVKPDHDHIKEENGMVDEGVSSNTIIEDKAQDSVTLNSNYSIMGDQFLSNLMDEDVVSSFNSSPGTIVDEEGLLLWGSLWNHLDEPVRQNMPFDSYSGDFNIYKMDRT